MQIAMAKLKACLTNVFPRCDTSAITLDTTLGEIPDWDSMNSINFLMELESTFSVPMANEILRPGQKVAGVIELLRQKGAQV